MANLAINGELMPHLELAHHPVHRNQDYNGYLGAKALKKIGEHKWNRRVRLAIGILRDLIHPDKVYIGGNARKITFKSNARTQLISNQDGILGGFVCGNRCGSLVRRKLEGQFEEAIEERPIKNIKDYHEYQT